MKSLHSDDPRLPALLEAVPALVAVTTVGDGRILYANSHWLKFIGTDRAGLARRTIYDVYVDRRDRDCLVAQLREHGTIEGFEAAFRRSDGSVRRGLVTAHVAEWDGAPAVLTVTTDITESYRIKLALKQSEQRYARLSALTGEGILIIDGDHCLDANPAISRLTGFGQDELTAMSWSDLFAEEYRAEARHYVEAGAEQPIVLAVRRKDGSRFEAEIESREMHDDGFAVHAVAVRDVTRRRQAEQGMVDALQDMAALLNGMRSSVIKIDAAGHVLAFNQAAEEAFGYSIGEMLGQPVSRLMPPDLAAGHQAHVDRYTRTGEARIIGRGREVQARRKDGSTFPAHLSVAELVPLPDGTRRFVGNIVDISEIKQAGDDLRRSEAELKQAQAVAQVGSWSIDLRAGKDVTARMGWSEQLCRILGIDPGAASTGERERVDYLDRVHPEDRERAQWMVGAGNGAGTEAGEQSGEYRVVRPDGGIRHVEERTAMEHDDAGEPIRIIGTVQDITERKQGEMALIEARLNAEAASQAKSRFLAVLGHEIRTPLNAVIGFGQLLQMSFGRSGAPIEQVQHLRCISENSDHLLRLLNDMIEYSHVEFGRKRICEDDVCIGDLLDSAGSMIAGKATEKGISLRVHAHAPFAYVTGDRSSLLQVLTNLLDNAVKYTPAGGTVELQSHLGPDGSIQLTVGDTGAGIAPEALDRIFMPFEQSDPHLTREHDGLGIGLALAKHLVELHRGRIEVTSTLGAGSVFTVTLPGDFAENADPATV